MKFADGIPDMLRRIADWLTAQCARAVSATERGMNFVLGVPPSQTRDGIDTQFLPAALEIVETPPSPVGRAVSATIVVLFCIAIAWACLGKIDVVITAPGKIVASGGTKFIQPFETQHAEPRGHRQLRHYLGSRSSGGIGLAFHEETRFRNSGRARA